MMMSSDYDLHNVNMQLAEEYIFQSEGFLSSMRAILQVRNGERSDYFVYLHTSADYQRDPGVFKLHSKLQTNGFQEEPHKVLLTMFIFAKKNLNLLADWPTRRTCFLTTSTPSGSWTCSGRRL